MAANSATACAGVTGSELFASQDDLILTIISRIDRRVGLRCVQGVDGAGVCL